MAPAGWGAVQPQAASSAEKGEGTGMPDPDSALPKVADPGAALLL